jgi:hypothetical protein
MWGHSENVFYYRRNAKYIKKNKSFELLQRLDHLKKNKSKAVRSESAMMEDFEWDYDF